VIDKMASVGTVKESERRATRKEPPFVGLSRETIQERFNSAQSIPVSGPTVPTTENPDIGYQAPTKVQKAYGLQEGDQAEAQEGDIVPKFKPPFKKHESDQEGEQEGDRKKGSKVSKSQEGEQDE
jgi:hypothetical protein